MPYVFNPYTYSYDWYDSGTTPPVPKTSGSDYVPGYADSYYQANPQAPGAGAGSAAATPTNPNGTTDTSGLDPTKRNAYDALVNLFKSYGLETLAPKILEMIQQGYGSDTITLMLQDTPEYKARFKANDMRKAAGLSVLSPAEYLGLERTYRQLLESHGLPAGFYDSVDDFTNWIGSDVSPSEINDRVDMAATAVNNSDNYYLDSLRAFGLGQGDLVAAILDRGRALPLLQRTMREAQIASEALRNHLAITQDTAGYYESLGVTQSQARSAYQQISEVLPDAEKLGLLYGERYGQGDLEQELMGGSGLASAKRKRLANREIGAFSGSSGIGDKTLGRGTRGER